MPALRQPARPRRTPLPAAERQAALSTSPRESDGPPGPAVGAAALDRLRTAPITVEGRLVSASNTTLYCSLGPLEAGAGDVIARGGPASGSGTAAEPLACVYKPVAGERPLWDFPTGTLAAREVAAYEVSAATGWDLVPPTVLRDGPFGPGMCQLWADHEPVDTLVDLVPEGQVPAGWFGVFDAEDGAGDPVTLVHRDDVLLRRTVVLDAVINNADRKAGHLLPLADGGLRVVDHGVCFNVDPKLRTVLWGWAGEELIPDELDVLATLRSALDADLGERLADLLDEDEVRTTRRRVVTLLRRRRLPAPSSGWPSLPWPPF